MSKGILKTSNGGRVTTGKGVRYVKAVKRVMRKDSDDKRVFRSAEPRVSVISCGTE